jgi:ribosomal protein S18 acetylase RimI-like enzyme
MADIDWKAPLAPGYYKLESNQIAALVTFLEMREPAPPRTMPAHETAPALTFTRFTPEQAGDYRALYRAVGEEWGWFSRLAWTDKALADYLAERGIAAFHVTQNGTSIGLVELDARAQDETELAFFGVTPDYIGRGFARPMMDFAITQAFARPIERLFVHTCTLDHPSALRFYEKSGFRAYQRAVEIATDPRATGLLPGHAFPHFPRL